LEKKKMGIRFFKPEKGPEKIADILSKLFVAKGWGRKQERLKLEKSWAEAAGEEYAEHTRVIVLKKGVLEVSVDSSALLQELTQYQKRPILMRLRKLLPASVLTDLRFKYGKAK
jgi:predicted nucleic acid-binding Zn ribbon protein